jgi:hypothetical protein
LVCSYFRQQGSSVDVIDFNATQGSFPGLTFNPAQILHGEEFIEVNPFFFAFLASLPCLFVFIVRFFCKDHGRCASNSRQLFAENECA